MKFIVIKRSKYGKPIASTVAEVSSWHEAIKLAQEKNLTDTHYIYIPLQKSKVDLRKK